MPRKSVEPIALTAGTAVRTLQEFLITARWDHASARDALQHHLRATLVDIADDPIGTVGVVDDTTAIALDPRDPFAFLQRGRLRAAAGELTGAVADFTAHIERDAMGPLSGCSTGDRPGTAWATCRGHSTT